MARKSTGKRLRFEVFKRDHFTCQYCGAQPPDVVLVADHITPVVGGGSTVIENLIAACEACNQGKADKPLGIRNIRPDADLLYLETQQEIGELRRYQEVKHERDAIIEDIIVDLQATWENYSQLDWHPAAFVLRRLLGRFSPEIVERAVMDVAEKTGTGYIRPGENNWLKYLQVVVRNMSNDAEINDADEAL